jgi:Domain of unknown function DUF302
LGDRASKSVRLVLGNPLIMKEMVAHVPDAASYAPVTVLIDERADGVHLSYDLTASFLAPYENSLQRRANVRALALSPVCTPSVLSETTATSMLASSMNEMVTSGDHRRAASPPTGACAFSVSCQKKSGSM